MSELVKITAKQASEILKHFELSEEAVEFADKGNLSPSEFIQQLIKADLYFDAVKFLAHGLPKREAIWWACLAVKKSMPADAPAAQQAALNAAEQWAMQPNEEKRQLAKAWSEKTQQKSAASWAATSAFWSGGSMAKPGEPDMPAPPFLYAHAVSGAISMAAFAPDPDNAADQFKLYIRQGLDLAAGGRGEAA
ncbi:DUF6931 family protein [Ketobacter alkanivorans]|uniref:Twin-arginine translocation pathway signal n=1 Tax=Ketobacter alkanivorans TaxID=1917421 RepID=A0A2K9LLB2_9GAMM|nr:hypothetical protein [Ketobacter alkanivorans]AUM13149.1 hypothetical protein Kalk_12250 [Ketobacter alkanivorans]